MPTTASVPITAIATAMGVLDRLRRSGRTVDAGPGEGGGLDAAMGAQVWTVPRTFHSIDALRHPLEDERSWTVPSILVARQAPCIGAAAVTRRRTSTDSSITVPKQFVMNNGVLTMAA